MVKLNGPRAWMMDGISDESTLVDRTITYINNIPMVVVGLVDITLYDFLSKIFFGSVQNYVQRSVGRKTTYLYNKG